MASVLSGIFLMHAESVQASGQKIKFLLTFLTNYPLFKR